LRALPTKLSRKPIGGQQEGLQDWTLRDREQPFAHFGEERCLRGKYGSGTIFFNWCNLRCVFCQNYEISWMGEGRSTKP
jgi:uncharacterized Fe-S radical SAM superfamily protein PflX